MELREVFIQNPSIEDFAITELKDFFEKYLSLCNEGRLPQRKDVTPVCFSKHLSMMAIVEVTDDNNRLLINLFGSEYADLIGIDPTGSYIDQVSDSQVLVEKYSKIISSKQPYLSLNNKLIWGRHDFKTYNVVACPLFDEEKNVQYILSRAIF